MLLCFSANFSIYLIFFSNIKSPIFKMVLGLDYNNWLVINLVVLAIFVKMIFQSTIGWNCCIPFWYYHVFIWCLELWSYGNGKGTSTKWWTFSILDKIYWCKYNHFDFGLLTSPWMIVNLIGGYQYFLLYKVGFLKPWFDIYNYWIYD